MPESVGQARTWDRVKHEVMRLGVCEKCAAQYAWGVQVGFTLSNPPCVACTRVVAQHGGPSATDREQPPAIADSDRTALLEVRDLVPGVAELEQDLLRVLAELGGIGRARPACR